MTIFFIIELIVLLIDLFLKNQIVKTVYKTKYIIRLFFELQYAKEKKKGGNNSYEKVYKQNCRSDWDRYHFTII